MSVADAINSSNSYHLSVIYSVSDPMLTACIVSFNPHKALCEVDVILFSLLNMRKPKQGEER